MYSVWAEWDIGQEGILFKTEDDAMKWCRNNGNLQEVLDEEPGATVDDLIDEGLLGFTKYEIY